MQRSLIVFAIALATSPVLAQSPGPLTRTLSLAECVQLALEHNLDLKIERIEPEIAQFNVSLAYAGYEPRFDFQASHGFREQPPTLDQQDRVVPSSTTDNESFSSGITGLLPTGLTYDIGVDFASQWGVRPFVDQNGVTIFPEFESSTATAAISLRQPLLKNFWIDSTRMNIRVSKKMLKRSEDGFRLQVMNIINSVEQAYYELILARENIKVQEKALQLAERLLAENKKRVEVGALAPLDEKQAESQVAARRADLLAVQRTLATQQNVLKSLLSDNYSLWQDVAIEASDALTALPKTFSLQDSWQRGLSLRPDLAQAKIDLERMGIVLQYQKNQLYPQLDVFGSYGRSGASTTYGSAFRTIEDGQAPSWAIGGVLSIPLGNRAARTNYRISKSEQQQSILRLKKLEQDTMVLIDEAVQRAQSSLDRVGATKAAREYAEAALEAEQKKLENGKSTSFVVLSLQRDLTSASVAELQALADYNKALANLSLREGANLERNNIRLDVR